ncbi:hypothetical protein BKA69DRAFT_425887 [Paraphysoderma sedebokerense]|nr:hypothetical protein BKA69DRAFT_425887 [Paraphysoderma sedebokerense]
MAEFTSQSREERTIRSLSVLSFFCLPSILSNHQLVPPASSRPIIDPSFLQKHAIFSFKLTPSLEITSPLYSLFTSPFYHPSLRHFLSHGIIIWSNGYTLNRGFEGTLLTALGGNISYIIGCTIDWYFSETERIDVSASWTRAVEGTKELLWKGVSQVDVVNVGNQYKGAVEGTLLKLRSKLFGYSVYGMSFFILTFFSRKTLSLL